MRPAGATQVEAAQQDGRWDATYPPSSTAVAPPDLQAALDADPAAAARYAASRRNERYAFILALTNARQQATRDRRIATVLRG